MNNLKRNTPETIICQNSKILIDDMIDPLKRKYTIPNVAFVNIYRLIHPSQEKKREEKYAIYTENGSIEIETNNYGSMHAPFTFLTP